MLLHTQNRNCSSATGNNLCADDAGLRGMLRKFLISETYCRHCKVPGPQHGCDVQHNMLQQGRAHFAQLSRFFAG